MRSQLKVYYRESRYNPAVVKFYCKGTVNGIAVRSETQGIHTGLHFVGLEISLGFIESYNNVVRADGSGQKPTYEAKRAVNEAILEQVRRTIWHDMGNIYPPSMPHITPSELESEA